MLPSDFVFSQASLQDFADCRRRFQYRYLMQLHWPALPAEPPEDIEHLLQLGNDFHRLVHQHQLGIPEERLSAMVQGNPDLHDWWRNYLAGGLKDLPELRFPEVRLRGSFAGRSVVGNYDLLAIEPGRQVVIVDWKTSRHRPGADHMLQRLQSRIYPALMVQSGAGFNGGVEVDPEIIQMRYWYPEHPQQPIEFQYDRGRYDQDKELIGRLIEEVTGTPEEGLVKTEQVERCQYCVYRSLCDRGQEAGLLEGMSMDPVDEEGWEEEFDFDQIAEVTW